MTTPAFVPDTASTIAVVLLTWTMLAAPTALMVGKAIRIADQGGPGDPQ